MSDMLLHLDEFGESNRIDRRWDSTHAELSSVLDGTEYGPGADGRLITSLEATRVGTTIRIRGTIEASVGFECGRCLESRNAKVDFEFEYVLMARSEWEQTYSSADELELDADDLDVSFYEGEEIDVAPLVREALLIELPTLPRCADAERDECDAAFEKNVGSAAIEENEAAAVDLRWGPLKDLKLKD